MLRTELSVLIAPKLFFAEQTFSPKKCQKECQKKNEECVAKNLRVFRRTTIFQSALSLFQSATSCFKVCCRISGCAAALHIKEPPQKSNQLYQDLLSRRIQV